MDQFAEEDEKPLDPAVERVRRKMMRLLAVSIGIMMTGLMAVLFAIVYKLSSGPDKAANMIAAPSALEIPADGSMATGTIDLPAGTRIVSQSISGALISLLTESGDGQAAIMVYDMNSGKIIAQFAVRSGEN